MADRSFLAWPFFEPRHRELAKELAKWCAKMPEETGDLDGDCRALVRGLGSVCSIRTVQPWRSATLTMAPPSSAK